MQKTRTRWQKEKTKIENDRSHDKTRVNRSAFTQ